MCIRDRLKDLLKGDKATNLYWVKFLDKDGKYVQLNYVPKETSKLLAGSLSRIDGSVVLTSATLSAGDDYQYYADSIGLNQVDVYKRQLLVFQLVVQESFFVFCD